MCLGIPGQIVEIADVATSIAVVDVSGVRRKVNVTCVAGGVLDDLVGKWVLVHVGFAMALIDEDEARRTMDTLVALGEAQDEFEAMLASDRAIAGKA